VNNIRQGEGTMRWYDLGQEYTGHWQNGLQNGQGENTWYAPLLFVVGWKLSL